MTDTDAILPSTAASSGRATDANQRPLKVLRLLKNGHNQLGFFQPSDVRLQVQVPLER